MRILLWLGGAILGCAVLLAAAALLIGRDGLRAAAEDVGSSMLGRPLTIGGLDIDPGWTTHVGLTQARIANPAWAEAPHLVYLDRLIFDIRLWPLLGGTLDVPRAELSGGAFDLERDAEGRRSWDLPLLGSGAADIATPDTRVDAPRFGEVAISDVGLRYRDAVLSLGLDGRIRTAAADGDDARRIDLTLDGTLGEDSLAIYLVAGSLAALRGSDDPYPVKLAVDLGETRLTAEGTMRAPFDLAGIDAAVALAGPDLSRLLPSLDLPLPATPAYSLSGRLTKAAAVWRIADLEGRIGSSDLAGTLSVASGEAVPRIEGRLVSQRLAIRDLAPLIGLPADFGTDDFAAPPKPGAKASGGKRAPAGALAPSTLFPTAELDPDAFHTANAEVSIEAVEVVAPPSLPVTAIRTHATLRDGRLLLEPFEVAAAGGRIAGEIAINARSAVPSVDADLDFRDVELRRFFRDTRFVEEMGGRFSGNVYLIGTGLSLAQLMTHADGSGSLVIEDGAISGLAVELIGLDIAEALVVVVSGDAPVPMRCGRIDLAVTEGIATIERALVDTDDSVLVASGTANLATERFDLRVEARAKDFSLIDLAAPVTVRGPMRDPAVGIGGIDPLPFLEMGDQDSLDCAQLIALDGGPPTPAEAQRRN